MRHIVIRLTCLVCCVVCGAILTPSWAQFVSEQRIIDPEDYDSCGSTALFLALRLANVACTFNEVRETLPPAIDGTHSFAQLARAAAAFDTNATGYSNVSISNLPIPCIVHLIQSPFQARSETGHQSHFAIILAKSEGSITIADPPFPVAKLPNEEFETIFTGAAMVIAPARKSYLDMQYPLISVKAVVRWFAYAVAFVLGIVSFWILRTRPLAISGIVGIIILACIATTSAPSRAKHGRFLVAQTTNLGLLPLGIQSVEIPVSNFTDDHADVIMTYSTCGCASVNAPVMLAANSTSSLQVEIDVREGSGGAVLTLLLSTGHKVESTVRWVGRASARLSPPRVFSLVDAGSQKFSRGLSILYPKETSLSLVSCSSVSGMAIVRDAGDTDRSQHVIDERFSYWPILLEYNKIEVSPKFVDTVTLTLDHAGEQVVLEFEVLLYHPQ